MSMIFRSVRYSILGLIFVQCLASSSWGSAFVRGAYYRLGDDDPGATAGSVGNDPTVDSFADHLDLTRFGSPHYTSDVPPHGPGDKLSMQFGSIAGPTFISFYGRSKPLAMDQQGYALEAWAKVTPAIGDGAPTAANLVAYNGTSGSDGFGFFQDGNNYVARVGSFDRVLGPAESNVWHHLAYVNTFGTEDYYFDGKLVLETTKDPVPVAASGGFWIGGQGTLDNSDSLFNGMVDEVRYQSFNPMAAGAFSPAAFLITVPEPSIGCLLAVGAMIGLSRRHRRSA